jgi:hypothetical protein
VATDHGHTHATDATPLIPLPLAETVRPLKHLSENVASTHADGKIVPRLSSWAGLDDFAVAWAKSHQPDQDSANTLVNDQVMAAYWPQGLREKLLFSRG